MTVAPATLAEMIASTRFEATRKAVVDRLGKLLQGVSVVAHPGKLDMNDYLTKAVVRAPGVAVGWNRMRARRDLGGSYGVPIDFVAYIVVEDYADTRATPPRRIERDVLANAIGSQILRILADDDTACWGLRGISPPMPDPEPEMRPVFTMKSAEQGTALFVVAWTQLLVDEGRSFFGGATPRVEGLPDGMIFELPPEGEAIPTEILAMMRADGHSDAGEGEP